MHGWSLRSPGAREAVHITLLSLLANILFLGGSALLTKRFDAEEKMFALLSLADALGGAIVLARFALSRRAGAESAATLVLGVLCVALGGAGATADVLSGGRVWFLDAAITLALCAVFGVVGVVGLCVDARSGCCGRGGAAGERTPLKT